MLRKCCAEKCRSMFFGTDGNVILFIFPTDDDEYDE